VVFDMRRVPGRRSQPFVALGVLMLVSPQVIPGLTVPSGHPMPSM
jgi:hypothetical protein